MNELTVQIAAPIGRDASLLADFLHQADIAANALPSLAEFTAETRDSAGALLVAEEALTPAIIESLGRLLAAQPTWSDLPFLILISGGRAASVDVQRDRERLPLGHLTTLERPLRPASLLSAVKAALRARRRQFEIRDTTRILEEANATIRMSEQRSRLILESTQDCIKLLDLDGKLLSMNIEGQKRLGIGDFGKVCGLPWLSFWQAADAEEARIAMDGALAGRAGSFEGFFETPEGEATWWDVSVTPVRDDIGQITHLLAVSREITDRKRTERALIQNEKLAAVGRLVSAISHEINNPLEAVTNLIYIAMHADAVPEDVKRTLASADEELKRASQIVSQTLRFHRQTTGPRETTTEDLTQSVLALYRGRLANSHITVEVRHDPAASFVCFEGELRQVLSNLIGNAIDAMRGGGRLLIRTRRATHPRTHIAGVTFTVADNGHGMPPDVAHRIFDAFYTTKGDNGTGLGLWISKGLVEKHHGTLTLRSSPNTSRSNSGTVFRMFLPAGL